MNNVQTRSPSRLVASYVTWFGSVLRALIDVMRPKRYDELGREQGQTMVRITLASGALLYLLTNYSEVQAASGSHGWLWFLLGFIALSIAEAIVVYRDSATSIPRRTAMNVADVLATSFLMIETGGTGIPLFVVYLWVTLGNGLRFGPRAMVVSAGLSLAGFTSVLLLSSVWQQMPMVATAVVIALIALPIYTIQFIMKRQRDASPAATPEVDGGSDTAGEVNQPSFGERLRAALGRIRVKRHDELGREQGQAVVRVVILAVLLTYLLVSHYPVSLEGGPPMWFVVVFSYFVLAAAGMVLAFRDNKTSMRRRTVTSIADMSTISYLLISTGEAGIPFFVLYLWVALGNGFRFGIKSMVVSTTLAILGFSMVVAFSELWQGHPMLSVAVYTGLILIPGYTAHLIRQLHLARQRAEEASAAKSHFLARMSHELRTPLNGILGTSDLLSASKRFNREDRSLLSVIRDSVKVSLRQIENILDFSKIEAGKLQIERIDFDLHELLNRTARLVRGIAAEKNLRLMLRIDPAVPYRLSGDPHHVQEVLINLISNAVKFTDKGYVSVDAALVHETERSALVRIAVHDTGIGIEPAALERIFEAFSQENVGTTRRYGGTGLGTTIAKQLVELMGGRMSVASTKGRGSTFSAEILFARQAINSQTVDRLTGIRSMLISKSITVQDRLTVFAQRHGVSVQTVATSAEAEGLLRRGIRVGNPIHVVFADSHAVLTCSGGHCADDFMGKAALAFTPVYLVCDLAPEETQLRQWGYAGALSYDLPHAALFNLLHASGVSDADDELGVVRVEPWAWGQPTHQRARLLIVDDNRTNLMIMRKILETANFEVDTAEDGERALDMMLRGRYKAAILDMHMPGLDGIAVLKQYRMTHRGARTPVIMLTANATVDAQLESAEAGADAYLTKPATATSIIATLERVLDETEVHDLARSRPSEPVAQEVPILDTTLLTELDRMYNSPAGVSQIIDEFESECRRLLDDIGRAVGNNNHGAFCDLLHALKGNGANVGALRLAQTCQEAEAYGLLEFRREGEQLLRRLENSLAEAVRALREFTTTGEPGPAEGSDLH